MSVSVVGAGAWGTARARLLAEKGEAVTLRCREPEVAASIRSRHVNERFLPGAQLPESLEATGDLAIAVLGADFADSRGRTAILEMSSPSLWFG